MRAIIEHGEIIAKLFHYPEEGHSDKVTNAQNFFDNSYQEEGKFLKDFTQFICNASSAICQVFLFGYFGSLLLNHRFTHEFGYHQLNGLSPYFVPFLAKMYQVRHNVFG